MDKVLELQFSGWTATPRMPFILSGNAVCMPVPSYSLLLGLLSCCLGRLIKPDEVKIGFQYSFDTVGKDLETRQRLEFDGKKVKAHSKGTDAYLREFHVSPKLTLWLDRTDWDSFFLNPVGTPSLGRSQDLMILEKVSQVAVKKVEKGIVSGCMLPFKPNLNAGGQLLQLAEAYKESEMVGGGRTPTKTGAFIAIPYENKQEIATNNLYQTVAETPVAFYLHQFY